MKNTTYTKSKIIEETIKILDEVSVKGISNALNLGTTYNTLNSLLQQLYKQEEGEGEIDGE